MMYVSGAYRIGSTGPLMETQHVAAFHVADLAAYLEAVIASSHGKDVPLVTWTLGSEPEHMRLIPVKGRGTGYLFCYANRDDLDVRCEVLRHVLLEGGPSDGVSPS